MTKPLTVTVAGEEGNPYADLNVYVFNGETYAGYSGKTDGGGHVTFTLPEGSYHFRADYDGVQFWSGNENTCTIPGCEEDSVILPGGTGEQEVSIDYTYDALNRLISAEYSNGTAFGYTYDAAGNVLTYAETHYGKTTVTTYTYDAANQLLTATEDDSSTGSGTVWQYSYDGNGSLIQTNPGSEVANGSTRYTYNTAGYLTKVENFTTEWQTQSEMTYDGLGNRLEVTTYTDGEGNTTRYVLDGGTTLTEIGTESSTYYLYGRGVIGTLGESWNYILSDGAGSTRQLVDEEGTVNLSVSYTPWGDTMEIYGSGMLNLGYLGGVYDAGTGLIYMGNGQYYDPSTGRFLTRGAQQDQSNPYTPWNSDPAGMLIAPLALLALVFGRKKYKTRFDQFMIIFVLMVSVGLTITAFRTANIPDYYSNTKNNVLVYGLSFAKKPVAKSVKNSIPDNSQPVFEIPSMNGCNEESISMANSAQINRFIGTNISLSPSLPKWYPEAQYNPYFRPYYDENQHRFSYNLCGLIALTMIYDTYYPYEFNPTKWNDDILYKLWSTFNYTTSTMHPYELLYGARTLFNDEWEIEAHNNSENVKLSFDEAQDINALQKGWTNNLHPTYSAGSWSGKAQSWVEAGIMTTEEANLLDSSLRFGSDADQQIWNRLTSGKVLLMLTNLDTSVSENDLVQGLGKIVPYEAHGHWVIVTGMTENFKMGEVSNSNWVRMNDPYSNSYRILPWELFRESISKGEGSAYPMVEIKVSK